MRLSGMSRIVIGLALACLAFLVVTFLHLYFYLCSDCGFAVGLPFTFERMGGWTSERRTVWLGAIGDFIFYTGIGLFFARLLRRSKKTAS
jgi:hypothetical protein